DMKKILAAVGFLALTSAVVAQRQTPPAQAQGRGAQPAAPQTPVADFPAAIRANVLRGEYSPHRANNDLLYYHLDVRIDPDAKKIAGKNTIRFKMLKDDTRIQLDLMPQYTIEKMLQAQTPLAFYTEANTGLVD